MTEPRELKRLAAELEHAARGTPWHGASLAKLLDGVTAVEAFGHPIRGAHSIWEIVLHLVAWTHEATHRLRGGLPGDPADGDWPDVPHGPNEEKWESARGRLITAHEALLATIVRMDPDDLDAPAIPLRDHAQGIGVKHRVLVHGIAQHHAYHGGQIALLRRALHPPEPH